MEPEKKRYLENQTEKIIQSWVGISAILGIVLFMSLGILDFFATPENFKRFLGYRIIVSVFLCILYFLNKLKRKLSYQYIIVILGIISSAIALELMILQFGGHESVYYAGINLLILCLLGVLPLNLPVSLSVALLLYLIYLFPILAFDRITNLRSFISNNVFIFSTIFVAFIWRILSQKNLAKELELQYDLDQEKSKLEKYSHQLEELVAERTKELSISEQKYRALFDNANDGVAVLDKNGAILNVNQRFSELHGFDKETLLGTYFGLLEVERIRGEKAERMEQVLSGYSVVYEAEHHRKDGSRILLEISSKAIDIGGELFVQSFHRDITERKKLQEQLFQSQKMESIGLLAGSIAHDFNNILSAILGYTELLLEFSSLDATSHERVRVIESSARRATQMISKLLSFARKGNFEMQAVSLNDIVQDTLVLLERMLMKRTIDVKMQVDRRLPTINGDSNQLGQIVMNLMVNAMDAMPKGGSITVSTSFAQLGKEASHVHPLLNPGRYVILKVADTGIGIPDEIKGRIFDPFFTTKEPGKGTGLGLAMIYGIVKEHKGVINVYSQVDIGSTFEVYLPVIGTVFPKIETQLLSVTGQEKIFLIDDEPDVLGFMKDVLISQGYRVLASDNPAYAMELFNKVAEEIDLVITDMVMPLANGRELIRHFKSVKPSVKIIAISRFEIWNVGKKDEHVNAFIRKPFEGIYLASVVRKVLDTEAVKDPYYQS